MKGKRFSTDAPGNKPFCNFTELLYMRAKAEGQDGAAELMLEVAQSKSCAWAVGLQDSQKRSEDATDELEQDRERLEPLHLWNRSRRRKLHRFFSFIKYHLGLTHQFGCEECGAPIGEIWAERWGGGWEWKCDFCGYERGCLHRPNVLKPAHRRVLFLRKLLWRLRHAP